MRTPTATGGSSSSTCPIRSVTSDTAKVSHYLQDTATAVDFLSDGAGGFSWSPDYDEDPASATYNPVPMVADGATPIAASLMDAYRLVRRHA